MHNLQTQIHKSTNFQYRYCILHALVDFFYRSLFFLHDQLTYFSEESSKILELMLNSIPVSYHKTWFSRARAESPPILYIAFDLFLKNTTSPSKGLIQKIIAHFIPVNCHSGASSKNLELIKNWAAPFLRTFKGKTFQFRTSDEIIRLRLKGLGIKTEISDSQSAFLMKFLENFSRIFYHF